MIFFFPLGTSSFCISSLMKFKGLRIPYVLGVTTVLTLVSLCMSVEGQLSDSEVSGLLLIS